MSRVDTCMRVIAISSRGIPSGGFVYGLPQRIANRIGRNLGLRSSLMTRRLPFRLQEGRDLATFLSPLRHRLCSLASCLCSQLFTLVSDDSRNLRRDYKTDSSRFADMFEKDCVSLLSLPVGLDDIELSAADPEWRDNARYRRLRFVTSGSP